MNRLSIEFEPLVRILAAILFGAVIGFEREANDQAAGLRTHISVALGACVFGIISTLGFEPFEQSTATHVRVDVTRVASQVVVGIGFIGAGVIFRHGATVRHLTTAASLWVTAAIGLAAGIGDLALGFIAAVALMASLALLRIPRRWIRHNLTKTTHEVKVGLRAGATAEDLQQVLRSLDGIQIKAIHPEKKDGHLTLRVTVEASPNADWGNHLAIIADRDDVAELAPLFEAA